MALGVEQRHLHSGLGTDILGGFGELSANGCAVAFVPRLVQHGGISVLEVVERGLSVEGKSSD